MQNRTTRSPAIAARTAEVVRRALADPYGSAPLGPASTLLARTVARIISIGAVSWQVLMLGAIAASSPGTSAAAAALSLAHVVLAGSIVLAWRDRLPFGVPVVLLYLVFLADWAVTEREDAVLQLASIWMLHLGAAAPTFTMRRWPAVVVPVVGVALLTPATMAVRPEQPNPTASSMVVTFLAIVVATRLGYSVLVDVALRADRSSEVAVRARESEAKVRLASRTAAEHARVLHDTVINTLAALASGGVIGDPDAVRARCRHDLGAVEAILAGAPTPGEDLSLRTMAERAGITVRSEGLGDRALVGVPPEVRRAVVGAVGELVRNAEKHAGVPEVRVRAERTGGLVVVTVADDGVGFDPADRGTGLAHSVVARIEGVGGNVELASGRGTGTTITLRVPLTGTSAGPDQPEDPGSVLEAVLTMRRRAAFLWAAGVAVVGLVLAVTNHRGAFTTEHLMAAVAAAGTAFAWLRHRRAGRLRNADAAVLAVLAPVAFAFAGMAVDFGADQPLVWQAIGSTGLLVLLVELASRRWLVAAHLFIAVVVVVASIDVAQRSAEAALLVWEAALVTVGLVAGWAGFRRMLERIGRQAQEDQRATERIRLRAAEREAVDRARARWRESGLTRSAALLGAVADGRSTPTDVRIRCAEEERYLRQVILLSPDLVHAAPWFARALSAARDSGVDLTVRAGDRDLDHEVATTWGRRLLELVETVPRGAEVTVTLFEVPHGVRLTFVGPNPHLSGCARRWPEADLRIHTHGRTDAVEVSLPVPLLASSPA